MNIPTRRDFFKSAAFTAASAAIPVTAMAYQGPITETTEPELPEWFRKLCAGEGDHVDDVQPWQDTSITRALARHIEAIRELLAASAPEPLMALTGFQLHWIDGIPVGVWASGRTADSNVIHHRPEFGWNRRRLGLA